MMLIRIILVLSLLFPAAAFTQELDTAVSALVRISGTRDGTPVWGTGFVIGFDRGKARIVTASRVIEGLEQIAVTFAVDPGKSSLAGTVLGLDAGNPNGLAALQVRGALPAGVTTLSFETESRPRAGEVLSLLGFPKAESAPLTISKTLSAQSGPLLLINEGIGDGFSGGPVLQGGKVVGIITDIKAQTTHAVNAIVARTASEGWGVSDCVPGQERTENGIVFVRICSGTFIMGANENDHRASDNQKPVHRVTLSEFWLGRTEITNEQFHGFRPDHVDDSDLEGVPNMPVTKVNWFDAKAACEHFGGRLPTEAEWEYAARTGKRTTWSFGDDEKMLDEYAWYDKTSSGLPHPVGTKRANSWGLYDMDGNVSEWVADKFSRSYPDKPQTDPTGPREGDLRVVRGNTFRFPSWLQSPAVRRGGQPKSGDWTTGFRCARSSFRQP